MKNLVILIGYLGSDVNTHNFADGGSVCNFSLATSETWKNKNTNEKQTATEWHKIVAYNKLSDTCTKYLKKGDMIYLEGKITTNKWTDKDNVERYTTEIRMSSFNFINTKGKKEGTQVPTVSTVSSGKVILTEGDKKDDLPDDLPF